MLKNWSFFFNGMKVCNIEEKGENTENNTKGQRLIKF